MQYDVAKILKIFENGEGFYSFKKKLYFCTVKHGVMLKLTQDKIEYMVMLVNMFARRFSLSDVEAYRYISQHQGIELMDEFYDVMHTQSFPDMVESMAKFCAKNGGNLA